MKTLFKILNNEWGQVNFWGGFLGGLNQGISQAEERKRQREALDLQKKKLDLEDRMNQFKMDEMVRQAKSLSGVADQLRQPQPPERNAADINWQEYQGTPGEMATQPESPESRGLRASMIGKPPAKNDLIAAGLLEAGKGIPAGYFSQAAQQPNIEQQLQLYQKYGLIGPQGGGQGASQQSVQMVPSINPKTGVSLRGQVPREAVGAESRIFEIQKKIVEGRATPEEQKLFDAWVGSGGQQGTLARMSGQRAQGSAQGKLDVTSSPQYLGNQTDIAAAKTAGAPLPAGVEDVLAKGGVLEKTIADIRKNFNPDYLGPVRGSDTAFAARRTAGGLVGAALSPQETRFRQGLSDAKNQIVYLLSGKQINEAESKRLEAALPKATDEPQVFLSGLNRFEEQMRNVLAQHKAMGTTTRGQVGAGAPATRGLPPPPAGWR